MAKMTVRSTYALDQKTDQSIRELARDWDVSQAEVIRRSMRQAAIAMKNEGPTPAEVVAHYQSNRLLRSRAESDRMAHSMRALRHEDNVADFEPFVTHGLRLLETHPPQTQL